jgi:hypothetical protein
MAANRTFLPNRSPSLSCRAAERDGGDRQRQHDAPNTLHRLGNRDSERAGHRPDQNQCRDNGDNAGSSEAALGHRRVTDSASRHLRQQGCDGADAQYLADHRRVPPRRRQANRDERTKAGLHVGDEQIEPAQACVSHAVSSPARVRRAARFWAGDHRMGRSATTNSNAQLHACG